MPASLFPRPRKSPLAAELFRIGVLLLLAFKSDGSPLFADELVPPDPAADRKPQTSGLATDRKTTLALEEFRKHLTNPGSDAAVDDFRRLQTSEATTMVPADEDGLTFVPLYRSIFENFYKLPAPQRRRISESAAGLAERNLQEIVSNGQFEALPQHILRFAGTEASLKAHVILARLHLNRGNQLGAKGWLTPLAMIGVDDSYRQTAQNILNGLSTASTGPAPSDPPSSEPEIPKHIQWNFQNQLSPKLGNQIKTFLSVALEATITPQTTWCDKIDGDTAYRRTLRGLIAVDLSSGKPRWHYPIEPQLDASLAGARSSISAFGRDSGIRSASSQFATFQHTAVANAFCRDNISGQITSDEDRIYFVAGLGSPAAAANTNTIGFMGRTSKSPFLGSQLVSLEKKTGRRVWSAGGSTFDLKNVTLQDVTPGLAGTQAELANQKSAAAWFTGIPAINRNRLFSVMESAGEMRLVCFAARTGEQLWNTTLAWPEQSIDKDPVRQLWSATPVAKQGVVYCPTTTGWVSCVDEFTRSAIWAGRVQEQKPENPIPGRRGQPVVLTQPTSLQEQWATSEIVVVKDSLIVLPHEVHEIVILNPTTGQRKKRIAIDSSSVLLHLDDTGIVYSQEAEIICRNPSNGEVTWSQELPVSGGRPTGTAIRRNGSLLVPMTSGAIARLSLATGKTEEVAPNLLPKLAWGRLTALDQPSESSDFFFSTPNQLLRISDKTPVDAPADSVKIATDLMANGKWREALAAAQRIPRNDRSFGEASEIAFRSLVQLALEDPAEYLPQLQAAGKSSEQIAQIHVLEFNILINQEKVQAAAEKLTELLKLPPSQLQLFVPELPQETRPAIKEASNTTGVERTLQTWAINNLSQLLDDSPNTDEIVKLLGEASTSVLLQLTHSKLLPAIHQRIAETTSREESMQLLSHAVEIKSQKSSGSSGDFDKEIELLSQIVTRVKKQSSTAEGEAARLLLNVAAMEPSGEFGQAVSNSRLFSEGNFSSLETMQEQHRSLLETRFGEWSEEAYRTIPIARLSSSGQIRKTLTLADSDDPFLNHFNWAATNGEYGRLLANGLSGTQDGRWSIPGNYQLHSTYSYQQDMLHRVGSILLLKSWTTLTAVSVLDQRVLWSRTYGYAPMTTTSAANTNFEEFVPGQVQLPSQRLSTSCDIVGSGRGWVALVSGSECSMVDIITGSTLWKRKVSPGNKVFATKNAVVIMDGHDQIALLDSKSGDDISFSESTNLTEKGWIPIRNSEELLVCWTRYKGRHSPRLGWVDPLTGQVIGDIDLSDMTRFHFINDSTLIGFNNQQQLLLVGLVSRDVQRYSFTADSKTSVTPEEAETLNKNQTPADLSMWDAERLQVAIDGLNLYVCNRRSRKAQALRGPSNRNLSVFTGELIAINRESGEQRWSFHDSGHVMATTDEPGFPLLLVIDAPGSAANGTVFQRSVFRGVSKLSGKELFRQAIPTTSGLRTLSLVSPTANIIDLGVHGLRVRIDGSRSADTAPRQKKE